MRHSSWFTFTEFTRHSPPLATCTRSRKLAPKNHCDIVLRGLLDFFHLLFVEIFCYVHCYFVSGCSQCMLQHVHHANVAKIHRIKVFDANRRFHDITWTAPCSPRSPPLVLFNVTAANRVNREFQNHDRLTKYTFAQLRLSAAIEGTSLSNSRKAEKSKARFDDRSKLK